MADTKTLIEQAYSAFNRRDIDDALALMTQDVSWPKASESLQGDVLSDSEVLHIFTVHAGLIADTRRLPDSLLQELIALALCAPDIEQAQEHHAGHQR